MNKPTRGGARLNAGLPAIENKTLIRTLRLTDEHWLTFKRLGGAFWLKSILDNAQQKSLDD